MSGIRAGGPAGGVPDNLRLFLARHARLMAVALLLLPPVLGLLYIKVFGVNVVNYDQWEFVPLVEKLYTGTLGIGDLFALHNEHRLFFPRIVMLALAYATEYNVLAEMYASWAFALGTGLLILSMYARQFGRSYPSILGFAPVAWLLFSFRQFENMLWGWQVQVYMCVFGFIASLFLLERSERPDWRFASAILFAVVSSFSFVNGLLVWPVNLAFILLSKGKNKPYMAALWALAGGVTWGVYLFRWASPSGMPAAPFTLSHIGSAALYFLINVGAPLAFEKGNATAAGIVLLALMAVAACLALRHRLIAGNAAWICLALFSLAISAACVVGRSGLGVEQALSSRYTTFTSLAVIGTYFVLLALWNANKGSPGEKNYALLFGAMLSMVVLGLIVGYTGGIVVGGNVHDSGTQAMSTVLDFRSLDDGSLEKIYPHPDRVRRGAEILARYGLNVFSGGSPAASAS